MTVALTTEPWVSTVADRPIRPIGLEPWTLKDERVLITGGLGSIGLAAFDALEELGVDAICADIDEMDVTDAVQVQSVMDTLRPTVILHLAGAKHAPDGELDPMECVDVNTVGTRNVVWSAPKGCRIVTASTCKACDPETAYGASKLIAERITLNAGHVVARFHNVVETYGNVFQIWAGATGDIEVAACERHFISIAEAIALLMYAAHQRGPKRFIYNPGLRRDMQQIAAQLYPDRTRTLIAPRRGDRINEPLIANSERIVGLDGSVLTVASPCDPVVAA